LEPTAYAALRAIGAAADAVTEASVISESTAVLWPYTALRDREG
jgi:hypothetical protein